jgi:hypothetical protein
MTAPSPPVYINGNVTSTLNIGNYYAEYETASINIYEGTKVAAPEFYAKFNMPMGTFVTQISVSGNDNGLITTLYNSLATDPTQTTTIFTYTQPVLTGIPLVELKWSATDVSDTVSLPDYFLNGIDANLVNTDASNIVITIDVSGVTKTGTSVVLPYKISANNNSRNYEISQTYITNNPTKTLVLSEVPVTVTSVTASQTTLALPIPNNLNVSSGELTCSGELLTFDISNIVLNSIIVDLMKQHIVANGGTTIAPIATINEVRELFYDTDADTTKIHGIISPTAETNVDFYVAVKLFNDNTNPTENLNAVGAINNDGSLQMDINGNQVDKPAGIVANKKVFTWVELLYDLATS